MTKRFLIFGCLGWCIEILWTGFHSLLLGDGALTAKTYLWMFPIYGAAAFASPLFLAVRKSCPLWQRLGLYSVTIFLVEFAAGGLIRLATGVCPWDVFSRRSACFWQRKENWRRALQFRLISARIMQVTEQKTRRN